MCCLGLLDKVPLNVYGSFGHAPVITNIGVLTVMDTIYDKKYFLLYCRNTSYHVNFLPESEMTGNIEEHNPLA